MYQDVVDMDGLSSTLPRIVEVFKTLLKVHSLQIVKIGINKITVKDNVVDMDGYFCQAKCSDKPLSIQPTRFFSFSQPLK